MIDVNFSAAAAVVDVDDVFFFLSLSCVRVDAYEPVFILICVYVSTF